MKISIEIRRGIVEEAIRQTIVDKLLTQPLPDALNRSFNIPYPTIDSAPTPCVIDHISIGDISIYERIRTGYREVSINLPNWPSSASEIIEAPKIFVEAMFHIPIISEAQLRVNGAVAPGDDLYPTTIYVDMEIGSVTAVRNSVEIELEIRQIRLGIGRIAFSRETAPDNLLPIIDMLNAPEILRILELDPLTLNFEDLMREIEGLQIRNVGIKVKERVFFLEVEAERDHTTLVAPFEGLMRQRTRRIWQNFYETTDSLLTDSMSFGVFISEKYFGDILNKQVIDSIEDPDDPIEFDEGGWPKSTWNVDPPLPPGVRCSADGRPTLQTKFDVTAVDVCPPFDIDIDASVTIDTQIFITEEGVLRIEFAADLDVSKWDNARCVLANAHLLSLAGFLAGGTAGHLISSSIGGILGGLAGGIATLTLIRRHGALPDFSEGEEEITAIEGRENAYFTEVSLDFPTPDGFGSLSIENLLACNDGLVIGGPVTPPSYEFGLLEDARISTARFEWISREYRVGRYDHRAVLRFHIPKEESTVNTVIWESRILSPSSFAGNPDVNMITSIGIGGSIQVNVWMMADIARELIAAGEIGPLEILVRTNCGSRIVTVPGLSTLDIEELEERIRDAEDRARIADRLWDEVGMGFRELTELMGGMPEAPPSALPRIKPLRWWNFQLADPGQGLNISLGRQEENQIQEIAELERDKNGNFNTEVWEFSDLSKSQLSLRTHPKHVMDIKKLTVISAEFEGMSTINVLGSVKSYNVAVKKGHPTLDIQTTNGIFQYDLSVPRFPRLLMETKSSGIFDLKDKFEKDSVILKSDRIKQKFDKRNRKKCQTLICGKYTNNNMKTVKDLVILFDEKYSEFSVYQTNENLIKRRL